MLKKLIIILITLISITGCMRINTPEKRIALFFNRYQMLDNIVLDELNEEVKVYNFDDKEKKDYLILMKKQYQSFSYKIKDIKINSDKAIAKVEVIVLDYENAIKRTDNYYKNLNNEKKIMKYRLKEMSKVEDYKKENININLFKQDGEWIVESLSGEDKRKLQGLDET